MEMPLLSVFQRTEQKQGRKLEEIKTATDKATSGDYSHLLQTLIKHSTEKQIED